GWGFSYALRPYLAAIVGALFMKIAALFTESPRVLLAASRMCSVLSVTVCCFFCLRLGHRLFERRSSAVLFAVLVCFLPQVMFLGMYQNNDALSLCAVSIMLYYFAEGCERKWPVKSCVGLAVGFSAGLLSYYSIYGWILMCAIFCVLAVLTDPEIQNRGQLICRRAALIAGICLLLAGWFFIRNALLHDGDYFGIAYERVQRARMEALGYRLHMYRSARAEGLSLAAFFRAGDHWFLRLTGWSFIGVFGYLDILLPMACYRIYYAVFVLGLLLFLLALPSRRLSRCDALLALLVSASVITFALHVWQSYSRDYQPQGRYVITLMFLLGYIVAYGLDNIMPSSRKRGAEADAICCPAAALTVLWLLLFAWACFGTMTKMLP
ncbi:MAG: DUF2142 domain-containing protein, partial [Oscillospiraceae bacterium]|nr:DUF2142 domain-containing protein [Oscillospiraceae bacterium]